MPQSPSDPILILGKDAISTAIAATLKLQSNNCQQSPHIPTNLNHPSLILSITTPTNAIAQIHHLRSKLHWEGTFIAIVRTPTEHQQLHNLSIFGEPDGKFAYSTINGQAILTSTSPHLLTDILTIQQRATKMRLRASAWQGLLAKSSLYPLLHQIRQIRHSDTQPNSATPATIHQILTTIHSLNIDWDSIISHDNAGYIRSLKSQHPPGSYPSATEIPDILTNLQIKLANITG
jgi:hypothetical protein